MTQKDEEANLYGNQKTKKDDLHGDKIISEWHVGRMMGRKRVQYDVKNDVKKD